MQRAPQKQHEIIIIGSGDIATMVTHQLIKNGQKPFHITEPSSVHFLGNKLLSHDGEKIGFKRVLLVLPTSLVLPVIKGLDRTAYQTVNDPIEKSGPLHYAVIGGKESAVTEAIELALLGHKVSMMYEGTMLNDYDVSVQDVVRRHLKSIGVDEAAHHLPIATVTKGAKTLLLVKSSGDTRQISCDRLRIEKTTRSQKDNGLHNQNFYGTARNRDFNGDIALIEDSAVLSLREISDLATLLKTGKGQLPVIVHYKSAAISDALLISIGMLEQDIKDTHLSYQKSIARTNDKVETFHGFIKVLTSMRGELLSISGILPVHYDTSRLYFAVRTKQHITTLIDMFDASDPLREELLEVAREIS